MAMVLSFILKLYAMKYERVIWQVEKLSALSYGVVCKWKCELRMKQGLSAIELKVNWF